MRGEGSRTTSYDALSRATTVTVQDLRSGTTRTTAVSYPATGQPETVVTYSQPGVTTAITLDAQNRETVRSSETSAGTLTRSTAAFDAANRETGWTFRGVASSREFDAAGRLAKQSGEGFGGHAVYSFDPTTGRKSVESLPFSLGGAESSTCTYTDAGRLASADIGGALTTYAYDIAGNLTTVTAGSDVSVFSYDSANRLIAKSVNGVPDTAYTWDTARGWRTGEGPAGGAPVRTFTYTGAGRLSAFTDASTGTSASYTYDAAGQRTSSVVTQDSVTTTTTYTYEGLTLLSLDAESEEGTATSAWRIDYLTDSARRPYGGIYTSSETSPVAFGIVTTDRGDVRELTDGAGVPFARYDHDAYGNPTRMLSAATPDLDAATADAIAEHNVLRYAGYAFDEHSGLYYLSQRYYDPATCQFITKDPAKADGEESAYQYCAGDPVGKVDPSGEFAQVIVAGIVIPVWVVAAVVAAVVLLALPPDVKAELSRQMDAQIRSVTRSLKQRFPKDRYTWKWSTHKPHVSAATIKANLPKGSATKKAAWLVAHHRYRHHAHVDIYRNGVKVYRANI